MKYNLTIALIGMAAILLLLSGTANAQAATTNEDGEYTGVVMKNAMDEGTAQLKCDPCDYNVDYDSSNRSDGQ